jgi:hypothetical protein
VIPISGSPGLHPERPSTLNERFGEPETSGG